MKKTILLLAGFSFFTIKDQAQIVSDYDGNSYNTVTIGTQVWMKENLKVTHYQNGDSIGTTFPATKDISGETTPKYQWAYNGSDSMGNIYGRLYTWHCASDNRNVCPTGWHLPSDAEWNTLKNFLGGESLAGAKLKEAGTVHWRSPNSGSDNSSGFLGLPGGNRAITSFRDIGSYGIWWSSGKVDAWTGMGILLSYSNNALSVGNLGSFGSTNQGNSVRCMKDATGTGINKINYNENIKIYPTTAIDRITIDCFEKQKSNLTVYNLNGTIMLQRQLIDKTNSIDISSLTTGIYIIQITGTDWAVKSKLIKE